MIKQTTQATSNGEPTSGFWTGTDRLDSWKEIASYLRREVRTVQLWEKREGLPVHRHFHKRLGSVYALRSEIESWKRQVSRTGVHQETRSTALAKVASRITIYVLPLTNVTAKNERRRICEAIATKTIAALQRSNPEQLCVVSPRFPVQNGQSELPTSLRDEQIDYVLRWSVHDEDERLRLNVALLFAGSDSVAWSHTYRRRSSDFAEFSRYAADQIVQCLWLRVFSSSTAVPVAGHHEKSSSRETYLKGRYFWNQRSEEGLRKAIRCFETAIHEDPEFALPYSGLADSLTLLSFYEIVSPSEIMPSARRAAQRAIELDPNLAEAHASLADVLLHFDRDWQGADHEYRRSIQCNPDYALGYHWYANLLSARGQHEAAHMAIMRALEINPVSVITLVWAGVTSHLAHQFDDAIRHYQSALELDPQFIWVHMYMAQALEQKGDLKEALREFETSNRLAGGNNCVNAMKAHAHAVSGDPSSARAILNELKKAPSRQCMPSYDIAATYVALGDYQQVVAWLHRACNERNMKLFTLTQDPRFDPLRRRSDFKQIVDQIGLSQNAPAPAQNCVIRGTANL
ncbi:MAG TPA: tetratricopeptide repeat protein [Candidatus Acidoferrum sp.]|nr:tetratricopeptide repeat protein [Candidatus Acidoferrum sp.]